MLQIKMIWTADLYIISCKLNLYSIIYNFIISIIYKMTLVNLITLNYEIFRYTFLPILVLKSDLKYQYSIKLLLLILIDYHSKIKIKCKLSTEWIINVKKSFLVRNQTQYLKIQSRPQNAYSWYQSRNKINPIKTLKYLYNTLNYGKHIHIVAQFNRNRVMTSLIKFL